MIARASHWLEAIPLSNISAESCAKVFTMHRIARFGAPTYVTTDQGKQFESTLFRKRTQALGIHRVHSSPYHPQSNGILERQHRTTKESFRCLLSKLTSWEDALPLTLLAMRSLIHSNGFTAATVVFGEFDSAHRSRDDGAKN